MRRPIADPMPDGMAAMVCIVLLRAIGAPGTRVRNHAKANIPKSVAKAKGK